MSNVQGSTTPFWSGVLRGRPGSWSWRALADLDPLATDAFLYGASALFALATALFALTGDYRTWGLMATIGYGVALLACLFALRYFRRRSARSVADTTAFRRAVVLALLLGVVVVPLSCELVWRAAALPGAHAQPEVAVIERAGDRVAASHSPYLKSPAAVGTSPSGDQASVDADTYFPYLPAMVVFGLPSAWRGAGAFGDARLFLAGFTLLVLAGALWWGRAVLRERTRVLQFLVVLPLGALPMVTGGDDLPVLALVLATLLLAQRRHPVAAGMTIGLAAAMKFTAWPVLVLLSFAVTDEQGRRASGRYFTAAAALLLPVFAIGVLASPSGFVENVVRFPLGLARIKSPAASPLLGQVLTTLFPAERRTVTALLGVAGVLVVLALLVHRPPRSVAGAAAITAFALLLATILAPATRFGYFIYPANLALWALVLAENDVRGAVQASSSRSNSRSVSALDTVALAPASSGVIDACDATTVTPTCQ